MLRTAVAMVAAVAAAAAIICIEHNMLNPRYTCVTSTAECSESSHPSKSVPN